MPKPNDQKDVTSDNNTTDAKNTTPNANANNDANQGAQQPQEQQPEYVTAVAFKQMQDSVVSLEKQIGEILGGIKSIKDAQGIMVKAGATIMDDSDPEPEADFKPLSELDFTVDR